MSSNLFLFGTRVDNLVRADVFRSIDAFLAGTEFHQIATVNPEFLLSARKDESFRSILNGCDLNVADGFGLHLGFWRQGKRMLSRTPGADLMTFILDQAERKNLSVFCAIRKDGLSDWEGIRRKMKRQYPKLRIDGIDIGKTNSADMLRSEVRDRIIGSHIVLCNFGAPFQERFLAGLRKSQGNIRLSMGVGGSFDFMTGKMQRAPRFMRAIGLEWLWRLIKQPSRFQRIANAVILFPLLVLFKSR